MSTAASTAPTASSAPSAPVSRSMQALPISPAAVASLGSPVRRRGSHDDTALAAGSPSAVEAPHSRCAESGPHAAAMLAAAADDGDVIDRKRKRPQPHVRGAASHVRRAAGVAGFAAAGGADAEAFSQAVASFVASVGPPAAAASAAARVALQ